MQRDGAAVGLHGPSLLGDVGGGERDVQALGGMHPGGVEDVGQPGAAPFGGRDRPVGPRVLARYRVHLQQFSAPVAAHTRVATTEWAVNSLVSWS